MIDVGSRASFFDRLTFGVNDFKSIVEHISSVVEELRLP